jgi:hypothetical protein
LPISSGHCAEERLRASVAILNAPPQLLEELEISRLRDMFPVFASEDEALARLADPTNISKASL